MKTQELRPPRAIRWPKSLYHQMGEMGWFTDRRVELIRGEIIEMTPLGALHFATVGLINRILIRTFGSQYLVAPVVLDLSPDTEPEPDLAVYSQSIDQLISVTPTTAVLVIEVSDSSLKYDRTVKAELYAAAGIEDYWIVNVRKRVLEVHRSPVSGGADGRGARYESIEVLTVSDVIAPLEAPSASISVASLFPPRS